VAIDSKGRVYVADRVNERIQVFDDTGKFLGKWTNIGAPWGLAYAAKEEAICMCDGRYNRIVQLNLEGQVLGVPGSWAERRANWTMRTVSRSIRRTAASIPPRSRTGDSRSGFANKARDSEPAMQRQNRADIDRRWLGYPTAPGVPARISSKNGVPCRSTH
jgi:hypothetical protein